MKDAFGREMVNGDIIVRIYDWGPWDAMIIAGSTPSGMLRTVGLNVHSRTSFEFANSGLIKVGNNVIIMNEDLLTSHIENRKSYYFIDELIGPTNLETHQIVELFLEEQRKIKGLNQ